MFTLNASDASHLDRIRLGSARMLVGLVLLHGPALAILGWVIGSPTLVPMLAWLGIAAAVTVASRTRPNTPATRALVATALCLMPALLVELLAGHPWQIDAHMYFFAALAVTALLLDFGALLAAAAAIALHHLVLDIALPSAVFPASSGLPRVLFHAVIVVFETAALGWLITRTVDAFAQAGEAQARTRRESELRAEEQEQSRLRVEAARQEAAHATADELERALGAIAAVLASSAGDLSASADALATAAETTSLQAGNAARDARETGRQIGTVAAASEQMTASVDEIDVRMAESLAIATEAVAEMVATDAVVDELSEGAHRIDEVVDVIARITAQTNLLALNATIEAARAGDAGKGFSVVAAEVKALAAQTARAADEIGSHIKHIRQTTDAAVQAIRRVRATIERSGEIATAIASAMTQQGSATHEISRAAQAVAEGTDRVVDRVSDVSIAATTASEAVGRVRSASLEVARQGSTLRQEIETLATRLKSDAA